MYPNKINIGICIPKGALQIGIRLEIIQLDAGETNIHRKRGIAGHHIQITAGFNQSNNFVNVNHKKKNKTVGFVYILQTKILAHSQSWAQSTHILA